MFTTVRATVANRYTPNHPIWFMTNEIYRQQTVVEIGSFHFYAIGKNERSGELSRRNAAMDVVAGLVVVLPPTHHQLVIFNGNFNLLALKSGDGQCNAQHFKPGCPAFAIWRNFWARQPFDVVGRIPIRSSFTDTIDQTLDLIEAE